MKILFLEDDENRIRKARMAFVGHKLVVVRTAQEAIATLKAQPFDVASLDHDLGGKQMTDSDENSGYAVAQFIAEMEARPDVIVHSFNPIGMARMVECLGGYNKRCFRALFDTPLYWQLLRL